MFFVKGWVPLSEVAHTVRMRRRVQRVSRLFEEATDAKSQESGSPNVYESLGIRPLDINMRSYPEDSDIWQICENARRIGILLANGTVVEGSKRLVRGLGATGGSNEHVNVYIGTVGSSDWNDDVDEMVAPIDLKRRYGDFLGLPILLPEACMEIAEGLRSLDGHDPSEDGDPIPGPFFVLGQSPSEVARRIVTAFDSGERWTKPEYREVFAPDLSVRGFELGWRLAVEKRPELARPGRRPREP